MTQKSLNKTDLVGGLALIAIGGWFAWQSYTLEIGTARRMGPGFFPMMLAGVLILLGLVIAGKDLLLLAKGSAAPGEGGGLRIAWRGILFIACAPILFGLTVRGLGFVPALFLACLLATQASVRMKPLASLVLAAAVAAFSTAVFLYGLNLPYRPIGPWLQF